MPLIRSSAVPVACEGMPFQSPEVGPSCARRGRRDARPHTSFSPSSSVLWFQGDGGLRNLIERGDDTSVGFVAALRDDESSELAGDVDVGLLQGAAGDAAESAGSRPAYSRLTGGKGGSELVPAFLGEALLVSEAAEGALSAS